MQFFLGHTVYIYVCKSVSDTLKIARVNSYNVAYKLRYEINFYAPIRGHHVYKEMWTPQIGETLYCRKDNLQEASISIP